MHKQTKITLEDAIAEKISFTESRLFLIEPSFLGFGKIKKLKRS